MARGMGIRRTPVARAVHTRVTSTRIMDNMAMKVFAQRECAAPRDHPPDRARKSPLSPRGG